jgi:magnesium chelatase family protein
VVEKQQEWWIADLEAAASIEPKHLSEAIQYRTLDRTYWA